MESYCLLKFFVLSAKEYEYRISYLEEPCDNFFEHACGFYREKEDLTINPYVDTFYERTQEVDMKIAGKRLTQNCKLI